MPNNSKIKRFMSDIDLQQSVRQAITNQFIKPCEVTDVNFLAAKMIAIELLDKAWKEMGKQSERKESTVGDSTRQIGM